MAKGKKTGGRNFKKGNPGRPPVLPEGIPSGGKLFAKMYQAHRREEFWKAFDILLRKYPQRAPDLWEKLVDHVEGKPKQAIEVSEKRKTVFREATPDGDGVQAK